MLTIICGEDNVESRNYLLSLKQNYQKKGYELININTLDIDKTASLFALKQVYFIENLNKKINKKNQKQITEIKKLSESKEIEIVDWEDQISKRELKIAGCTVKEFKPSQNIFKLTESCFPGNFKVFLNLLHDLPDKLEDGFIFIMLARHLRNLITIKSGYPNSKLASWQIARLRNQANLWKENQLTLFYDGLFRIDVSIKTGNNPYSLRKSLDILTSYFLR